MIEEKTRPNKTQHQHKNAKPPNNKTKNRDHTSYTHYSEVQHGIYINTLSYLCQQTIQLITPTTTSRLTNEYPIHIATPYRHPSTISRSQRDNQCHTHPHEGSTTTPPQPSERHHSVGVTTHNAVKPTGYPYATLHTECTFNVTYLYLWTLFVLEQLKTGYWYKTVVTLLKV